MADVVSCLKRSQMMAGMRDEDTKQDLVLPKHNSVIFINGCFWHGHECHVFKWPKSNKGFREEKT